MESITSKNSNFDAIKWKWKGIDKHYYNFIDKKERKYARCQQTLTAKMAGENSTTYIMMH